MIILEKTTDRPSGFVRSRSFFFLLFLHFLRNWYIWGYSTRNSFIICLWRLIGIWVFIIFRIDWRSILRWIWWTWRGLLFFFSLFLPLLVNDTTFISDFSLHFVTNFFSSVFYFLRIVYLVLFHFLMIPLSLFFSLLLKLFFCCGWHFSPHPWGQLS